MYPLLNKNFVAIKEQPLYCTLVSNFAGRRFFLKMNESAAKILQLCNGLNSVEEIKTSLAMTYAEKADRVSALVDNFLDYAEKLQFVDMLKKGFGPSGMVSNPDEIIAISVIADI